MSLMMSKGVVSVNRFKLNQILGYIRAREEFPFDVEDVEED